MNEIQLSVLIPVYNEEENLKPLIEEIECVLQANESRFEILYVDDGSTDRTEEVLRGLQKDRPHLRWLRHGKNLGQSAALATGFEATRGDVVVMMDGDGQNDPHDVPRLLEALTDNVAAVCGIRDIRRDSWIRKISSRVANGFRNWITGDRVVDAGCIYRAVRREALGEVPVFNGMHRFLPTILRAQGYEVVEISVNHRPRERGVSKYGIRNRLWRGIWDCFAIRWYTKRAIPKQRIREEEVTGCQSR